MKIFDKEKLPKELRGKKCFRVANIKKVSVDPSSGQWLKGAKPTQPLYTLGELSELKLPKNAKHLQFVPAGTGYSIIDFDTDKNLGNTERSVLVDELLEEGGMLDQFEGIVEFSASGYGLHIYVKDERFNNLPSDPYKVQIKKGLSLEVFAGESPIILTGEHADTLVVDNFDKCPKKVFKYLDELSTSTEEKVLEAKQAPVKLNAEYQPSQGELDGLEDEFGRIDKHDRLTVGYGDADDPSSVDFAVANMLMKESRNNIDLARYALVQWMSKWRPSSKSPLSPKEISRKCNLAIRSAYSKMEPSLDPTSLKDLMIQRAKKAEQVAKTMGKSRQLLPGMLYEGTLNTVMGKSGSGKSKMITIMLLKIAKDFPEKLVYYFGPDLSVDDVRAINEIKAYLKLENFYIDQDSTGVEFLDMMENHGKCDDAKDIVFVVDTVKKITPVNNKDVVAKKLAILKGVTGRGATGILIAHTNKDGKDMSGVAEFEQDVDNSLSVEVQYIGDDKMKSTMSEFKRCRSRITPITYEMGRNGFDYTTSDEVVDPMGQVEKEKRAERRGNIDETIISIVAEYADNGDELTTTKLRKEIMEDDYYTGTRKTSFVSDEIHRASNEQLITTDQKGRKKVFTPLATPGFLKKGDENEEV